jgi:ribosome-associated translation inhibitor RaiA
MRWPDWLNPRQKAINVDTSINLEGMHFGDPIPTGQTVRALRAERKTLMQSRKAIEKKFKRLTKLDAYRSTRSSRFSVDMQVYQFSEAIRDANTADQAGAALKEQIAAIERRIQEINQELARLKRPTR